MALIEGLRGEFADHDVYLHLLLGLVSVSRQVERLLPELPAGPRAEPQPALNAEEEAWVLAWLGVISMRRTLMENLAPVSAQVRASREGEAGPAPEAPVEALALLR